MPDPTFHPSLLDKKTKIVATLGPACESRQVLEQLIAAGLDIARINFSHGTLESHAQVISNLRTAAAAAGRRVAIMGDLPGPKMRIGNLESEPITLERGQSFDIRVGNALGNREYVSMPFEGLLQVVKPGNLIYVNDGFIQLEVESVSRDVVHTRVRVGGELRSRKGVNFPGIDLGISAFTERDREFLKFAAGQGLDSVSQSFVQGPEDVEAVRRAAAEIGYDPFIIAKIERSRALDNLDGILSSADGIMVARGDLGVEVPFEQIAVIQKEMIRKANLCGKPVITATHMLESMITNRRPTRAEVTDVANAILDGSDCVMLSGETSVGQYPADSVAAMASIASYTERHCNASPAAAALQVRQAQDRRERAGSVALGLDLTVQALSPDLIFAMSASGSTARLLSRFRLAQPIIAISGIEKTCQELLFSYGVYPVYEPERPQSWACYVADWVQLNGLSADLVLLTEAGTTQKPRDTTLIEIIDLREGDPQ